MAKSFTFRGLMPAVFTVFNKDFSINTAVIPEYAQFLSDAGIKGILVQGTTGEGPSLTVQERKTLTEAWLKATKITKQHLMVQVGGCPLPDVIELAKHAEQIGVDSLLTLPELYFKPTTPQDLIEYLKIIAEAAPKTPLLYYHIPAWSAVNNDFEKAQAKLKLAEVTSDLQSDIELDKSQCSQTFNRKRKVTRPLRFDSDEEELGHSQNSAPRPPIVKNIKRNTEAFEILLTNVLEIKQQNKKILSLLEQKESYAKAAIPDDVPVTFPLKNSEDLDSFEGYLKTKSEGTTVIVKLWASFGGKDVASKTNRILKEVLSDELAKDFNFFGRHTKKAFSELKLNSEIILNMEQFLKESVGQIPTFAGIKYTSNDLDGAYNALKAHDKYAVFLGADSLLAAAFTLGFDSAIATSLNIIPQYGIQILEAIRNNKVEEARGIQQKLTAACKAITKDGAWVPTMKVAMNAVTPINVGLARAPLRNLTTAQANTLETNLKPFL